jgi:uncharacterized DUF497 family protein
MEIEWDPNKADINLQKHGISFSDAEAVLFDPNALSCEDITAQGEQRLIVIGMDPLLAFVGGSLYESRPGHQTYFGSSSYSFRET